MRLGVAAAVVDGAVVAGDVEIDGATGTVAAVGIASDGGRGLAVPGLVDLQVNGMAGVDFSACDAAELRAAGQTMLAAGVTAYQPTLVTAPEATVIRALGVVGAAAREAAGGPRILGAHLEGPFLSPARLGAHTAEHRRDPDIAMLDRLLGAGPVRQVTLAPELVGAHDLIARLVPSVTVSLGHTDATAAEAHAAFDLGATTVTHLFNAMRPATHRDPGVAFAALARADISVQVILDGHHLAADTAQVIWRAAAGRTAVVTDAISVAGLGDGGFAFGRRQVTVRDGAVRLGDGTLAGSALTLDQALRNLVALGASVSDAVAAASTIPARIARADGLGSLAPGATADVAVLDDDLRVVRTLVGGVERFAS
jgi:N-acetylglucosamine-6-phosphate deacetylase